MNKLSDRTSLIRLAGSLPKGDATRRAVLAGLQKTSFPESEMYEREWLANNPTFMGFRTRLSPRMGVTNRPLILLGSRGGWILGISFFVYKQVQGQSEVMLSADLFPGKPDPTGLVLGRPELKAMGMENDNGTGILLTAHSPSGAEGLESAVKMVFPRAYSKLKASVWADWLPQ